MSHEMKKLEEFESTDYAGIDYAGSSRVNRDLSTDIRYGIIPAHDVCSWIYDELELNYDRFCPHCGDEYSDETEEQFDTMQEEQEQELLANGTPEELADFQEKQEELSEFDCHCARCSKGFDSEDSYSDEPSSQTLSNDDCSGFLDSSNDLWITESKYFTYAQYCSPCAPGACYLRNYTPQGAKCYCLPSNYFEKNQAPYPIYSVETGERIA